MNNQGTPEYCTVAVKVKAPGCSPRIPRGAPDFHHLFTSRTLWEVCPHRRVI